MKESSPNLKMEKHRMESKIAQKLRPRPSDKAPGVLESAAYSARCEHFQNAAQRRITACGEVFLGGAAMTVMPLDLIFPNFNQPRREFSPGKLEELAQSIRENGLAAAPHLPALLDRPAAHALAGLRDEPAARGPAARAHDPPGAGPRGHLQQAARPGKQPAPAARAAGHLRAGDAR
jgi:hypothetical protein